MINFLDIPNIEDRLEHIRAFISQTCKRSGRPEDSVELIAVGKGHPPETVRLVVEAGQTLIGENKVQEAKAKLPLLPQNTRCHLIGHLQKNKIRHALPLFEMIHSVDSLALAEAVNRIAGDDGYFPKILLQVNVSGEDSKFGFDPEILEREMEPLLALDRTEICGLMTLAPYSEDPDDSRRHFAKLREIRNHFNEDFDIDLPHLSMGMSGDFEVAIEEGATLVRVGTSLFGPRVRKNK